jgi:hypothetical protein
MHHPSPKFQVKLMLFCKSYCGEPDDPPPRSMLLLNLYLKKLINKVHECKVVLMYGEFSFEKRCLSNFTYEILSQKFHDTFHMLLCSLVRDSFVMLPYKRATDEAFATGIIWI